MIRPILLLAYYLNIGCTEAVSVPSGPQLRINNDAHARSQSNPVINKWGRVHDEQRPETVTAEC